MKILIGNYNYQNLLLAGQKFAMMELKVILSTILRYARIEAASKRSDLHLATLAILRNVGTMKIRAIPRTTEVY